MQGLIVLGCILLFAAFAMDKERQSLERQQQEYISIKQSNDLNIICHNGLQWIVVNGFPTYTVYDTKSNSQMRCK